MTDDYAQRAEEYGFATKEEVEQALKQPHAVVLDVRTEDEIAQDVFDTDLKWVHSGCRPTTCPVLEKMPEKLLPDKDGMCDRAVVCSGKTKKNALYPACVCSSFSLSLQHP